MLRSLRRGASGHLQVIQQEAKKVGGRSAKESLSGGGSVRPLEEVVVYGGECLQAQGGNVVQTVMPERELPVSALDTGTGALEQVDTGSDHRLDGFALLEAKGGKFGGHIGRAQDPVCLVA
jgi:hypothetical protein